MYMYSVCYLLSTAVPSTNGDAEMTADSNQPEVVPQGTYT